MWRRTYNFPYASDPCPQIQSTEKTFRRLKIKKETVLNMYKDLFLSVFPKQYGAKNICFALGIMSNIVVIIRGKYTGGYMHMLYENIIAFYIKDLSNNRF